MIAVNYAGRVFKFKAYRCRKRGCTFRASSRYLVELHAATHDINPCDMDMPTKLQRRCVGCGKLRPIWRFELLAGQKRGKTCLYCRRAPRRG